MNVAHWVMHLVLGEYFKIQPDGWTAQETWLHDSRLDEDLSQYEASASGTKRPFHDITPEGDIGDKGESEVHKVINEIGSIWNLGISAKKII